MGIVWSAGVPADLRGRAVQPHVLGRANLTREYILCYTVRR